MSDLHDPVISVREGCCIAALQINLYKYRRDRHLPYCNMGAKSSV